MHSINAFLKCILHFFTPLTILQGVVLLKILIISDLHLSEHRPKTTELFKKFLSSHASKVNELYILGDFFDYWIGDDYDTPFHDYIVGLLRTITSLDIKVFIMVGNRDFLLGDDFAKSCGARIITDPSVIIAKKTPYLLMHGDSLCTQEVIYSIYRKLVRSNFFKNFFLSLPIFIRKFTALGLRKHSQSKQYGKKWIDVSKKAVKKTFNQYNLSHLIHGHTHEFATHEVRYKKRRTLSSFFIKIQKEKIISQDIYHPKTRIVLGDWSDKAGSFVFINKEGHAKLHAFSPKN